MPAAVVPVVASVVGSQVAGLGLAASFGFLPWSAAASLVNAGLGFVVSSAINQLGSRALAKKPKQASFTSEAQGRAIALRSTIDTHKIIYGQARVSGPIVHVATTNSGIDNAGNRDTGDNLFLHMVIPLAGHEVEEIGTIYVNDQAVTFTNTAWGTFVNSSSPPYNKNGQSYLRVTKVLGTADQAASADLVTEVPGWTTSHRLRGIAYLYVRLQYSQDVFPLGIPNISAVVKGKKVYDPRDGGQDPDDPETWAWTDNAALCVRDYLLNECDVATARFDDDYTTAAANICEESVTLANGSSQDRYTCNGVVDTGVSRLDNLTALVAAMAGEVVRVGNTVRIFAGAYDSPAGSLNDDDLAGDIQIRGSTPRSELVNTVRGTYVDPNKSWQPTDFPPVTSSSFVTADGGIEYVKDLELAFTNHPEAAQRIGKLVLAKARQGRTIEAPYKHHALKFACWDTVQISQTTTGLSSSVFRIRQFRMPSAPNGPITLMMQEESSASYDWASGEAATLEEADDTTLPDPFTVTAPGSPQVTESLYVTTDGSGVKSKAVVTWAASTDAFLRDYQLEYKLTADSEYTIAGRTTATTLEVLDVAPGEYDIRVKALNTLGVSSEYATSTTEIVGLTAAPADLENFSLNAINNNAHLSWTQAEDLDVKVGGSIRIRYSKETSGATWSNAIDIGPALPGVATQAVLPLLTGTYLAKAVDSVGNESENAATIVTTVADIVKMNTVATSTQHPDFPGDLDNLVLLDGALQLDGLHLFNSADGDFDDMPGEFDFGETGLGDVGIYTFDAPVDVGKVAVCRVTADIGLTLGRLTSLFDSTAGDFDDAAGLFDGEDLTGITIRLEMRTTDDDPSGTPTWSDWRPFFVGDYLARGFEFRLYVQNDSGGDGGFHDVQVYVTELAVSVDMPDVVDQGGLTTSASGVTAQTFSRTFVTTPKIGTSIKNGATGDFLVISGESATGFSIGVKNSAGSFIARDVDWVARGY